MLTSEQKEYLKECRALAGRKLTAMERKALLWHLRQEQLLQELNQMIFAGHLICAENEDGEITYELNAAGKKFAKKQGKGE